MLMNKASFAKNRLLSLLPAQEYDRLLARMEVVQLQAKQILYHSDVPIEYGYFPERGIVCLVKTMESGKMIEVAAVGNEGMMAVPLLIGSDRSFNRAIVAVSGQALRMPADALQQEVSREGALHFVLVRYHAAFYAQILQTVACNGLHSLSERCCRWLLMMCDRLQADSLALTQEFIAEMLGARRASVSQVLESLRRPGCIHHQRGKLTVVNREALKRYSCECYGRINQEFSRLLGGAIKFSR